MGCRVYYIPQDFTICETAENALLHIPEQQPASPAVWIGYIPTPQRYEAVYKAALNKGIKLLNDPEQHRVLQPRFGIWLSNLFFTSLHAMQYNWDSLLIVFGVGMVLGVIRKKTNTTASAIVHGTYDILLIMAVILQIPWFSE